MCAMGFGCGQQTCVHTHVHSARTERVCVARGPVQEALLRAELEKLESECLPAADVVLLVSGRLLSVPPPRGAHHSSPGASHHVLRPPCYLWALYACNAYLAKGSGRPCWSLPACAVMGTLHTMPYHRTARGYVRH